MHTRYLIIPLAAAFFLSVLYSIHGSEPPAEWKKVDAKQFSFFIPPDMKLVPTQGIDSFVKSYRGTNIDLHFDFGPYSDSLKNYKNLSGSVTKTVKIDGKEAQQVSFTNLSGSGYRFDQVIAIHFRDLGDGGNNLTLWATCRTKEHYSAVEQIFSTLRFNKQHDAK